MARIKIVNGVQMPFTAEEEAERDAQEIAFAAERAERQANAVPGPAAEIAALTKAVRALAKGQAVPKAAADVLDAIDAKR